VDHLVVVAHQAAAAEVVHPVEVADVAEVNLKNNKNTYVESNRFAWVFL
jgi:predicted transcriptional regulator